MDNVWETFQSGLNHVVQPVSKVVDKVMGGNKVVDNVKVINNNDNNVRKTPRITTSSKPAARIAGGDDHVYFMRLEDDDGHPIPEDNGYSNGRNSRHYRNELSRRFPPPETEDDDDEEDVECEQDLTANRAKVVINTPAANCRSNRTQHQKHHRYQDHCEDACAKHHRYQDHCEDACAKHHRYQDHCEDACVKHHRYQDHCEDACVEKGKDGEVIVTTKQNSGQDITICLTINDEPPRGCCLLYLAGAAAMLGGLGLLWWCCRKEEPPCCPPRGLCPRPICVPRQMCTTLPCDSAYYQQPSGSC